MTLLFQNLMKCVIWPMTSTTVSGTSLNDSRVALLLTGAQNLCPATRSELFPFVMILQEWWAMRRENIQ